MRCQPLVRNNKYKGKYVALESFQKNRVVASGLKPAEVLNRAHKKGFNEPVLIFIPPKNMTQVY